MRGTQLANVIWKEGKHYVAQCLNVDVSSFGRTKRSALKNLDEALKLYFEDESHPQVAAVEQAVIVRRALQHA
ncbi:MAG: type II toxin-antitoxin system HicB family antitoxin [Candidatus Kerfeldbacteria bacterium]|nr:type II toxin-antitoxin system HicB family antitoxin [Candidatus Kerfeldbacteria bacterium]